jgi:hypothetical protein
MCILSKTLFILLIFKFYTVYFKEPERLWLTSLQIQSGRPNYPILVLLLKLISVDCRKGLQYSNSIIGYYIVAIKGNISIATLTRGQIYNTSVLILLIIEYKLYKFTVGCILCCRPKV